MSNSAPPLFIARKPKQQQQDANISTDSIYNDTSVFNHTATRESISYTSSNLVELTKNDKYCVSRLPAAPSTLHTNHANINGYSDGFTNYAVIVNENGIHVWDYTSTDGIPVTTHFPIDSNPYNLLPLAILVAPSAGSNDPGLVIINSYSGQIKFFESISSAPALGIINNKSIEFNCDLSNEFVTLAENVEPAGIMVATSTKRVLLLSLRDSAGRPNLQKVEVLKTNQSFFGNFLNKSNTYQIDENSDQIVAIRSNTPLGQNTKEVIIQDSNGGFHCFSCSRTGITKLVSSSILTQCISQIDGYLPGSDLDFKILDIQPMTHIKESKDVYCLLGSCNQNFQFEARTLFLFVMKIDKTGSLIYSTHRITRCLSNKDEYPRLFLPSPGNTAFIVLDNAVVLIEVMTSINPKNFYRPKWEDVIFFRNNVNIVGQGYENLVENEATLLKNPSVILITENSGILRVERFQDDVDSAIDDGSSTSTIVEPSAFIKSHIEQAIFYGERENNSSNPVEFDISKGLDLTHDDYISAIQKVDNEILTSNSIYIPPFLPSTKDHLNKRYLSSIKLIEYVHTNFPNDNKIGLDLKYQLIETLEKLNVSLNFWEFIENSFSNNKKYLELLNSIILNEDPSYGAQQNPIRHFFSTDVANINSVLNKFIAELIKSKIDFEIIGDLIIKSLYQGVIVNEIKYKEVLVINKNDVGQKNHWIFETDLIFVLDNVYTHLVESYQDKLGSIDLSMIQSVVIQYVELLFYLFDNAITFLSLQHKSSSVDRTLLEYKNFYESKKLFWNKSLMRFKCDQAAIYLSEKYHDFKSLVEILDTEREVILSKDGETSAHYQILLGKFEHYFDKFGYEFAKNLYDYYSATGKLQSLLLRFPQYNEYLQTYLSDEKHGRISWIRDVLDSRFVNAAEKLLEVSRNTDDLQSNRNLELSIAKLALLCSDEDNQYVRGLYDETNLSLDLIEIQDDLLSKFLKFSGVSKDKLQIDLLMKNFSKNLQESNYESQAHVLKRSFMRLIEDKGLDNNELVDMLTLLDTDALLELKSNFYWALKIVNISDFKNSSLKVLNEFFIWQRILLLDDWESITDSNHKSDEYVKKKVEDTVLFHTLYLAFKDNLFKSNQVKLPELSSLLSVNINHQLLADRFGYLDEESVDRLYNELETQNKLLVDVINKYNLDNWIKAVVSAAQIAAGGSNDAVDYSSLRMVN